MKIKHLIYWSDPSQEHKNSLSPLIIDENGELKSELSEYISELSIYNSVSLLENLTYEKGPVCISTRMYTMKVSKDKCHMVLCSNLNRKEIERIPITEFSDIFLLYIKEKWCFHRNQFFYMRDLDEREIIVLEEFTEGSDLLENYSTVVQNSDKKFIVVDNKHKKEELKDLLISQRQVCLPPYEPKDSVEYRYEEFSIFDIKMWLEEKGYHINFCERGSIHQPHLEWRKKNKFSFQDFIRKFAREKLHINDTNVYIDLPFEWGYHKNIKANISFERYPRTNHHELSKKVFLELCDKFEREGVEKKGSYNDVKDWNKIQDYIFNQTGEKTHRSRKKKWFGLFYEKLEIWLLRKAIKSIINSRNNESNK